MEPYKCYVSGCPQPAVYVCACQQPPVFLCEQHKLEHAGERGMHPIKQIFQDLDPQQLSLAFQAEEYLTRIALAAVHQALQANEQVLPQLWRN